MKVYFWLLVTVLLPILSFGQRPEIRTYTTGEGLTNNYINSIAQDSTGYMWFATRMGLNRYNGTTFRTFLHDPADTYSLPFNSLVCVFADHSNRIWIGAYGGKVASFDIHKEVFTEYSIADSSLVEMDVSDFCSIDGNIFLHTWKGWYKLENGRFVKTDALKGLQPRRIDSVANDRDTWMATSSGILHRSPQGDQVFTTRNTSALISNSIHVAFYDRDGNVWFGTHGGGVVKFVNHQYRLRHFTTKNSDISSNIVSGFFSDPLGRLWVASDGGGIDIFDGNKQLLRHIDAPGWQKNNSVLDFADGNDGWLWAAGWESGLFAINMTDFRIRAFRDIFAQNGLTNHLKSVAVKGDSVLCGTYGDGVVVLNRKTNDLFALKPRVENSEQSMNLYINDICIDSSGTVWVGSVRGLYRLSDNAATLYIPDISDPSNSDKSMIWSVSRGSADKLLLATSFQVYLFDTKNNSFAPIDCGINPPYEAKLAYYDRNGNILVGAFDNLIRIDQNQKVSSIKLTQSSIDLDIVNPGAIYQDQNSQIYIGTQQGFYAFFADSLSSTSEAPKILFESMKIGYKTVQPSDTGILQQHINETQSINLRYDDFPISLSFASINYSLPASIKFAYTITGLDSSWTQLDGSSEITIHTLQPGNYVLKIKNTNAYGEWSDHTRDLYISISPPFWQKWWFRLTIFATVILLLYIYLRMRIWRLKAQKAILSREVARQTKLLTDQNIEIKEQSAKLEMQADILQEKLLEVYDQKEDLEALNSELAEQTAEMVAANGELTNVIDTKNKLLSIIAHDVRNPFAVVLNLSQKLAENESEYSIQSQKRYAEAIHSASQNIYDILSDLLDWAMVQSGTIAFDPIHFKFSDFLDGIVASCRETAQQKNIRVSLLCPDSIWCYADKQMMTIAVRNLFLNAVKFTPQGGMISLHCKSELTKLRLEIVDTGIGMDEETVQRLFDIESIVSQKGTTDEQGHGLGLVLVKEFVHKNNGQIEVHSKKSSGSKFVITLPVGKETVVDSLVPEIQIDEDVRITINTGITIVLAEDNTSLREQLSKSLNAYYTVIECENAYEAIDACRTQKVDVVISDIIMGEMTGITLCKTIKNDLQLDIPVVIITGLNTASVQVDAYNSGADAFLAKPFEFDVLLARVQSLINNRPKEPGKVAEFDISALTANEKDFAEKLKHEVENGLSDPLFSVEILAQRLGSSRVSLFRKVKNVLGISPSEYIQNARLYAAATLLKDKKYRVSEIAYMVGYSNPQYFSNCFTKRFGMNPTEYRALP